MAREIETTCRDILIVDGDAIIESDAGTFIIEADNLQYSGIIEKPKAFIGKGVVIIATGPDTARHMVRYDGPVSATELAGMWGGRVLR